MNKGFTLVEVLVTSFLICTFTVSLSLLLFSGIKGINTSTDLTRALFMTKSIMEEMRSKPFNGLYQYNNRTIDNGAGKITVIPISNDLVSITIMHKSKLSGRQLELNTIRSGY